jgi:hypothetical protein
MLWTSAKGRRLLDKINEETEFYLLNLASDSGDVVMPLIPEE